MTLTEAEERAVRAALGGSEKPTPRDVAERVTCAVCDSAPDMDYQDKVAATCWALGHLSREAEMRAQLWAGVALGAGIALAASAVLRALPI